MRYYIHFLLFLFLTSAVGCQTANEPQTNEAAPPTDQIKRTERVPQTVPEPKRDQTPDAISRRLENIASRVPQVNDATAIVFGKYAIVGIDVNAALDRSKVGTIKYSVAEALKDDPMGANTLVTSDPDIVQRIREMNEDIKQGHGLRGFVEELADIVGRLIPQSPTEVEKREEPPTKIKQEEQNQNKNPKPSRRNLYEE